MWKIGLNKAQMSMCDHINGKDILKERRLIKVVFYL